MLQPSTSVASMFINSQEEIRRLLSRHQSMVAAGADWKFTDWLEQLMIEAVFGSNYVERAGTSFDLTMTMCKAIFRGEPIMDEVAESSPEYQTALADLKCRNLIPAGQDPATLVLRSRKEVIQHARAFVFITRAMVQRDELLTEQLILQTHRILVAGIAHEDGSSAEEYAGQYRQYSVAAWAKGAKKSHKFIHHTAVPQFMEQMVNDYRTDVLMIGDSKELDPFALASRYAWYFVNIHPFADGNGRMCRLILNAILLKYAGIVVPIGEDGNEGREEYLEVAVEGSKVFLNDDYTGVSRDGHRTLGSLVIKKACIHLRKTAASFGQASTTA
ncbi:MAG: hypothetical protein L6R39_005109 [Caloplaca ligustica]|nr:MAG: hypothetical protein L6R39_005109 [Caloplaca ligustica]